MIKLLVNFLDVAVEQERNSVARVLSSQTCSFISSIMLKEFDQAHSFQLLVVGTGEIEVLLK